MIPSSSSSLSVKSQSNGNRPSSSLSSRPPSRNTRTPNTLQRPASSASTRPQSRFSQRPNSRHARSRLIPICQTLVTQITSLREEGTERDADGEDFREAVEQAVKALETSTMNKAAASIDMSVVDRHISGHALKARINSRDAVGEALESAYQRLKTYIEQQETDLDHDIKTAHIPDHLQLLLALSQPPTDVTVEKAKTLINDLTCPPPPYPTLTWSDILAEEPFEGEHWEGIYGAPAAARSSKEAVDRDEWDSTPSLSPLNSDDLALDDEDDSSSSADYDAPLPPPDEQTLDSVEPTRPTPSKLPYSFEHRKQFEELQARQYWRDDWHTDAPLGSKFNIGDPSTLGPTLNRVLAQASGNQDAQAMLKPERYINEDDMVREILMALQGNRNIVVTWKDSEFKMTSSTPRLVHLSLASQESIISSLARTATIAEQLRRFSAAVFSLSNPSLPTGSRTYVSNKKGTTTRTSEAFADAIAYAIRGLDSWCAAREEAMCRAYAGIDEDQLIVSLLGTEKAIRDEYETSFEVLLGIVQEVYQSQPDEDIASFDFTTQRRPPAAQTALLLDTLFANVQQHMERRDTVTSDALMLVFVRTAEPVWGMMGRWLKDGMGLGLGVGSGGNSGMADELDDEFFIESSGVGVGMMGLGLLDPDFWKEGYALREGSSSLGDSVNASKTGSSTTKKTIPRFLNHVGEIVLGTGKSVGLMRVLDGLPAANPFNHWVTFAKLVSSETNVFGQTKKSAGLFSVSIDTLSGLIYDGLLPHCQATAARLVKVLTDECDLWKHLEAIEDLFLMRKGDEMSHFVDVLFTKMDSQQPWGDFHFLNTAFNDVIESNSNAGAKEWVTASLVRFSYRGSREKDRTIKRTIKAIDGLVLEYAVPFPLTYIFQPKTIQGYSEIFVFLLQIRRAKSVLERILVRDERGRGKKLKEEMKVFYAMRSRLSWFINALLNFLTTYVIHAEISRFHDAFRTAASLGEMIRLHDDHLEKIRGRCLLKPNTSALHRTILSVLDMCLHFSEGFIAFAGDTTATLDVSRQSIIMKRHRSRRQRRRKQNVIGFSQFLQEDDDSTDEEDVDAEGGAPEPSYSMLSSSVMSADEDLYGHVEKMSSELDGLVRFLRRGVESLAGGASEAAPAFGVLAFALEDWDM